MSDSTNLARVIVRQLIEAGITDAVLSPGSRNAPLSIALYQAEQAGHITLHVKIDERGAAFFALGLTKATGRPVPVICTSGTAVANFHPAVLEASHTNAPLLVLTADRPARLRRTGANQTTEQARIFGKSVRYFADISGSVFPMELVFNALLSGPVHLNLQFEEPLVDGESNSSWLESIAAKPIKNFIRKSPGTFFTKSTRGLLVVGHDRGGLSRENVEDFAGELGWPIIAEDPLSMKNAIPHASIFLTSQKIRSEIKPDTVIVIGRTTLSRSINALIADARKTIVIDPGHGGSDAGVDSHNLREAEIVTVIASRLQGRLAALGATVVLTRPLQQSTNPSDRDRANLCNKVNADLVVSIHCDAATSENAAGIATFHFGSQTGGWSHAGERAAQRIHEAVLNRTYANDCSIHARTWDLLRLTRMPAVTIDVGYITNQEDAASLADKNYLDQIAAGIADGTVVFFAPAED